MSGRYDEANTFTLKCVVFFIYHDFIFQKRYRFWLIWREGERGSRMGMAFPKRQKNTLSAEEGTFVWLCLKRFTKYFTEKYHDES